MSLIYTLIRGGGRLYIFIIYIMKIQCQNIMLNNLMSLSVSSVVAIVFTKAVFILFFAVSGVHCHPVSHDIYEKVRTWMSLCLEHALIVNYIASAQSCHYHYSYWQLSLLSDLMLYALCWWKIANLAACCDALCIYLQMIVWTVNVVTFTVPNEGSWRLLLCRLNSSLIISSISLLHIWIHSFEGSKLFAEQEIKSLLNGVKKEMSSYFSR